MSESLMPALLMKRAPKLCDSIRAHDCAPLPVGGSVHGHLNAKIDFFAEYL